ncbi:hypothetical protein AMTRI_Chr09g16320 [Amborella trichopoda]
MRDFFWSGDQSRKFHFLSWPTLCLPKAKGGFRIRKLKTHNKALLGKWWWQYASQPLHLWREVIRHKYCCGSDGWFPECRTTQNILGFRRSILHCRNNFIQHVRFHPQGGSRVKYWIDTWIGHAPLRDQLPALYLLAQNCHSSVAENFRGLGSPRQWSSLFKRDLSDPGLADFTALSGPMQTVFLPPIGEDKVIWPPTVSGQFLVSSFFQALG